MSAPIVSIDVSCLSCSRPASAHEGHLEIDAQVVRFRWVCGGCRWVNAVEAHAPDADPEHQPPGVAP